MPKIGPLRAVVVVPAGCVREHKLNGCQAHVISQIDVRGALILVEQCVE